MRARGQQLDVVGVYDRAVCDDTRRNEMIEMIPEMIHEIAELKQQFADFKQHTQRQFDEIKALLTEEANRKKRKRDSQSSYEETMRKRIAASTKVAFEASLAAASTTTADSLVGWMTRVMSEAMTAASAQLQDRLRDTFEQT